MVVYEDKVKKAINKGSLPKEILLRFSNVFIALDTTHDMSLFNIKKMKSSKKRAYYRVKKGKYRALFYIEDNNYFVFRIALRKEVYDQWESYLLD